MGIEGVITLVFSGIVAVSTIAYVVLTAKLTKQTRLSREFFLEAHLSAYLVSSEVHPGFISLVIKNIGKGVARNVEFNIIKDIDTDNAVKILKQITIFNSGVKYFPPDYQYKFLLMDTQGKEERMNETFSFSVSYSDDINQYRSSEFNLSFIELMSLGKITPSDSYIGQIAEELTRIRKVVEKK